MHYLDKPLTAQEHIGILIRRAHKRSEMKELAKKRKEARLAQSNKEQSVMMNTKGADLIGNISKNIGTKKRKVGTFGRTPARSLAKALTNAPAKTSVRTPVKKGSGKNSRSGKNKKRGEDVNYSISIPFLNANAGTGEDPRSQDHRRDHDPRRDGDPRYWPATSPAGTYTVPSSDTYVDQLRKQAQSIEYVMLPQTEALKLQQMAEDSTKGVPSLESLKEYAKLHNVLLISEEERHSAELFLDAIQSLRAENNPDVLDKLRAVRKDRQKKYGDSLTDFTRIAGMWSALIGFEITADDVTLMMICLKLSRAKQRYQLDNMIDVMGYALCHEDLHPPNPAEPPNSNPS